MAFSIIHHFSDPNALPSSLNRFASSSSPAKDFSHHPTSPELTMTLSGQEDLLQAALLLQHPTVNTHHIPHTSVLHEFQNPKTALKLYGKIMEGKA